LDATTLGEKYIKEETKRKEKQRGELVELKDHHRL
jgi:hypothetical protein